MGCCSCDGDTCIDEGLFIYQENSVFMGTKSKVMKTWTLLFAAGAVALGSGCADKDYDLSDVDLTVGVGSDSLVLPVSSTENIMLDDILDLENSDIIDILPNGDYVISKDGVSIDPVHPCVNTVTVREQSSESENMFVDVTSWVPSSTVQRIKIAEKTVSGVVMRFKYSGEVPDEIKELHKATIDTEVSITVNVSPALSSCISKFDRMTVKLPDFMSLKVNKATPAKYESDGHSITFTNVSTSGSITIDATVTELDFTADDTEGNALAFSDGNVTLDGVVSVELAVSEINTEEISSPASDYYLSSNMSMEAMTITGATGKFAPTIDLDDLGSVEINSVPDFLKGDDVHVALYNPAIRLTVASDMNVSGLISGSIEAVDEDGGLIAEVEVPEMTVNPNATTKICICKYKDEIDGDEYDGVYEVGNLSDVLKRIPHRIYFHANVSADDSKVSEIELGKKYTVTPSYSFIAPLAFDEGAEIVYRDTIDGWHDDIEDFDFMEGTYLQATANIENKAPIYLKVTAFAIDEKGREISSDRISVTVDRTLRPSADGETAVTTPLVVTVKELEKGTLKTTDGLVFKVEAMSGEEGSQSIVGKTINAYNQTLLVRDLKVKVIGKIIADLN